eukprot:gb/GECG01010089.1/.p1 GENE.gb/GECG01010089.1/~~gb/GECG01010089.1/.p1  ORF type:complete len:179 (+),score=19.45 gb/GECG01010089.1/:1-537(+)
MAHHDTNAKGSFSLNRHASASRQPWDDSNSAEAATAPEDPAVAISSSASTTSWPRASHSSFTGITSGAAATHGSTSAVRAENREEVPKHLPAAAIYRIVNRGLPRGTQLSQEAREKMQHFTTEFICFLCLEANEVCRKRKRKTISGDDLLAALARLGFAQYVEPLRKYLTALREKRRK